MRRVGIAICGLSGVIGGWVVPAARAQSMPATRVVIAEAKEMDIHPAVTLVGSVGAARLSPVRSEVSGVVVEVPVRAGDRVLEGQVLYRIDDRAVRARLDQAKARRGVLQARLEELLAGTRKEDLAELKAKLDETIAEVERWSLEAQRVENLYAGRDSHAKEVYDTRANLSAAQARRAAAQAMYERGLAGPREEEITRARHEVVEQDALIRELEILVEKHEVRAPFTGYVVRKSVEVGSRESEMSGMMPASSGSGGASMVVAELDPVLVWVDVPEAAFPYAQTGEPVRVRVDALNRAFEGRIRRVVPMADESARTFTTEIVLPNPDGALAAGMFARVAFPAGPRRLQVAVPKDAVVVGKTMDQIAAVIEGHDGKPAAMLIPVTVGASAGDHVAITSGNLAAGTRVVVRGNERILPFPTPIEIVDEQGTPVVEASTTAGAPRGSTLSEDAASRRGGS